jgi:phospholipid/cholesterol/gamma-HCH transport system substrate-binding protein
MDPQTAVGSKKPLIVVLTVVLICVVGFVYLFTKAGGHLPGQSDGYRISFRTDDIKNLQPAGEVRIAGVKVGTVRSQDVDGEQAQVELQLDEDVAPLHEGATVRVGVKSVIGQSFVEVRDGGGAELPEGTVLTGDSVIPAVDVDEVIGALDRPTRKAVSHFLRSLGGATKDRAPQVDELLQGVGYLGRDGYTAISALQHQDQELEALVNDANTILVALNTGRDQIGTLVDNAQTITEVTAGQEDDLAATVRALPGLLDAANTATGTLDGLGEDLAPVARDLDRAALDLSAALVDLPAVAHDLRALLPSMDASFGRAQDTLVHVPQLAQDLSALSPELDGLLSDLSPMVDYMQPWTLDLGSFFGNFGASFDEPIENGVQPVRLAPIFNEYSVRNNPLDLTTLNPLHWVNPYPDAGGALDPHPYRGTYPRVQQDP